VASCRPKEKRARAGEGVRGKLMLGQLVEENRIKLCFLGGRAGGGGLEEGKEKRKGVFVAWCLVMCTYKIE